MPRLNVYLALIASLVLAFITMPQSFGKLQSNMQNTLSVSTGLWATSINTSTGSSTTSPYTITWTGSVRKQYALVALINNGRFDLLSSHISYASVKTNGDTTNPPTLTFDLCSGTWNATNFTCSGTITTISTGTGGVVDITSLIPVGDRLIIRLTNLRDTSFNYNTTFNALASKTDIRVGQVLSS